MRQAAAIRAGRAGPRWLLLLVATLALLGASLAPVARADPGSGSSAAVPAPPRVGDSPQDEPVSRAQAAASGAAPLAPRLDSLAVDRSDATSAAFVALAVPLRPHWARALPHLVMLRWPHHGGITTYFGDVGPLSPHGHAGVDIAGVWGEPVRAAADGNVVVAGWHPAYGNNVIILHDGGLSTRYGHLAALLVKRGQPVAAGQVIGLLGSTGYSTGPHLHFEVRLDGVLQDPLPFLPDSGGF